MPLPLSLSLSLHSLARLNPSKFQRLNQRLQQGPPSTTTTSSSTTTSYPSAMTTQMSSRLAPSYKNNNNTHSRTSLSSAGVTPERLASIERLLDSLESVGRCFQSVQQPYALLLDLSDSRSFSLFLHQSIANRLHALLDDLSYHHGTAAKHNQGSTGERAVSISCLSSFLGYLSFRRPLSSASPSLPPPLTTAHSNNETPHFFSSISPSPPPSIDICKLLEPSIISDESSSITHLALHVPCIYSFILPFLSLCSMMPSPGASFGALSSSHPSLTLGLIHLMKLRSSLHTLRAPSMYCPLELSPSTLEWKAGASFICVRSLLDDLHHRLLTTFGPHCPFLSMQDPASSFKLHLSDESKVVDFSPDLSFIELCCPSIAQSCRELEQSAARFRSSTLAADQGQGEGASASQPSVVPPRRVYAHPVHFGSIHQQGGLRLSNQSLPPSYLKMTSLPLDHDSRASPSSTDEGSKKVLERLRQLFVNQVCERFQERERERDSSPLTSPP